MNAPDAPFEEPWQAQLFALTVALNEQGVFTWTEWAKQFGPRVQNAEPDAYWDIWAGAFVSLLEDRGLVGIADVEAATELWLAAARATPHGQPIELPTATSRKS